MATAGGKEQRNVTRAAIAHVGELTIMVLGEFIEFVAGEMRSRFEAEVFAAEESIYLGMEIAKITNEFALDGDIWNGAKLFTCIKSGSDVGAGEIQDVSAVPARAKEAGGPLTVEEQFGIKS